MSFKSILARVRGWPAGRKQLGMFWRFLFAMFLASVIGMELFVVFTNLYEEHRLIGRLQSPAFSDTLRQEFQAAGATLALAQQQPALCTLVLESLVNNNSRALGFLRENGPNSLGRMRETGRLLLHFSVDGRETCRYPPADAASSARAMRMPPNDKAQAFRFTVPVGVQGPGEEALTLVLRPLRSPALLWEATKEIPWNILIVFVAFLNLCCAVTLAPILVRRIKRAEVVARGWTEGSMQARINDSRNDEFGDLIRSFNSLADSFVDVIKVKQELAAVEERNRLARDLHDTAKQRAFALNLQLTALRSLGERDPADAQRLAASALSLVHHLQHDLSNVIKRLSASTIAELGMREVLRQEVAGLFEGSAILWQIRMGDDVDAVLRDAAHLAQQILLIVIEASANVLRHSGAGAIVVALSETGGKCTLAIEDDGKGFDVNATPALGMGLSNMRLRARSLPAGEFSIAARPGGGTAVSVQFQLKGAR